MAGKLKQLEEPRQKKPVAVPSAVAVSLQDDGTSLKQDPLGGLGGRVGIDDVKDGVES